MEIERRSFVELAVHVKLACEAVLEAARSLANLRPGVDGPGETAWRRAMDELIALNIELGFMEAILRASLAAEDVAVARPLRRSAVRG